MMDFHENKKTPEESGEKNDHEEEIKGSIIRVV
jgi:hypothetical protein